MVVTRSRLHAVRMKQALDAYIARRGYAAGDHPLRTLVAFSGPLTNPDDPSAAKWTEANLNGFSEGQLTKRFREDGYQLLVVAEKYQTGFDEPLLPAIARWAAQADQGLRQTSTPELRAMIAHRA